MPRRHVSPARGAPSSESECVPAAVPRRAASIASIDAAERLWAQFSTTRAALKRKVGNVSAQRRSRTGKLPDSSRQRASRPPKDFYLDLRAKDPRPNKSRELEEEVRPATAVEPRGRR